MKCIKRLYEALQAQIFRLTPRFYFLRDVVMIRWMDYEWIVKRYDNDWRFK